MENVGLIAGYNPFHNRHQYHISQSKKLINAGVTTATVSGSSAMRGRSAIYNKSTRAEVALLTADLVIELSATANLSPGDHFAKLVIKVADCMSVNIIVSDSENNNIKTLKQLARSTNEIEQSESFSQRVKGDKSYSRIISESLEHHRALASPNNILDISYLRAIARHARNTNATPIKRKSARHRDSLIQHHKFASGTSIRTPIINQDGHWHHVASKNIQHLYVTPHITLD